MTPEPDYDDRIAAVLNHLRATPSPPPSIEDLTRIGHLTRTAIQMNGFTPTKMPFRMWLTNCR